MHRLSERQKGHHHHTEDDEFYHKHISGHRLTACLPAYYSFCLYADPVVVFVSSCGCSRSSHSTCSPLHWHNKNKLLGVLLLPVLERSVPLAKLQSALHICRLLMLRRPPSECSRSNYGTGWGTSRDGGLLCEPFGVANYSLAIETL